MFARKSTSGNRITDKIFDEIYRVLNLLDGGSVASRSKQYFGLPIYLNHTLAPTPETGYATIYLLYNDYDFFYIRWPDGSRHNRRLAIDMEEPE
jgi:hypothetical protein